MIVNGIFGEARYGADVSLKGVYGTELDVCEKLFGMGYTKCGDYNLKYRMNFLNKELERMEKAEKKARKDKK